MKRRAFLSGSLGILAASLPAEAQGALAVRRVELGYTEDKSVVIERREEAALAAANDVIRACAIRRSL